MQESVEKNQEVDLFSLEKIDRSSPDHWSESVPSLNDFASLLKTPNKISNVISQNTNGNGNTNNNASRWMADLNKNDIELLNEMATLSTSQLMEKIKELMELAYQLDLEETNQITRGRLLNILDNTKTDA